MENWFWWGFRLRGMLCSALLFRLPDYSRPKPPRYSGYHRYQFRLYRQPPHKTIALSPEDKESLGKDPPCPRSRPRGAFPGLRIMPGAPGRMGMLARRKGILTGDVGEVLNPCQAAGNPWEKSGNGLASGIGSRERCGL